ncbi:hypothetical protein WH52_01375 [Tenacibaculum holothuriorum]|uniref:Peptidase M15A C-terminal domain-containing protein n=1 Tax=Tenacibaculum holothuriorum TaxID=1635173 RepID=A0A1Y2PI17_9FLAO|nr:D-Ala-D-Ala carboxypeptidase family metallohydrolase [Tenacibaculum holothuriorum]OSY89318.1 hypothetical protein WH52_01375 [Tenacibaculum holothuriorum]
MTGENHLSPYRESYGANIRKKYFQPKAPLTGDIDRSIKLAKNLYLYELVEKSFIRPEEKNLFTYVPMHVKIPEMFQLLRDALGKPITVTSFFRSERHEFHEGRSGTSQHTHGKAIDLTGVGLVDLIQEAVDTKNDLYHKLRNMGVRGIGIYKTKNFVHLDFRENIWNDFTLWTGDDDKEKKNESLSLKVIGFVVATVFIVVGGIRALFKRKKR